MTHLSVASSLQLINQLHLLLIPKDQCLLHNLNDEPFLIGEDGAVSD